MDYHYHLQFTDHRLKVWLWSQSKLSGFAPDGCLLLWHELDRFNFLYTFKEDDKDSVWYYTNVKSNTWGSINSSVGNWNDYFFVWRGIGSLSQLRWIWTMWFQFATTKLVSIWLFFFNYFMNCRSEFSNSDIVYYFIVHHPITIATGTRRIVDDTKVVNSLNGH